MFVAFFLYFCCMDLKRYFLHFALALLVVGCGGVQRSDNLLFSESIYTPEYASGFEILGSAGSASSLVRITRPWQGECDQTFELLILREGEKAPTGYSGAIIEGGAERIVALSSSNVAMFDCIGASSTIVGVSGLDYISSEAITLRAGEGLVRDVGYDSALNFELITALRPDIVLLYSVAGSNSVVTAKLTELGIPFLYIGDYAEESPLGKAEWVVAMGEICARREVAEEYFKGVAQRYNTLKEVVAVAEKDSSPRVVLNTPYRDVWYLPSSASYMVQLIEDAGGDYFYDGNTSSQTQPISLELAYKLVSESDIWLNTGASINSLGELRRAIPKFGAMPPVTTNRVYNSTARTTPMGGSDFYESGVVNPDVVLGDLIEILHPNIIEHQLFYYKQLE